MKEELEVNEDFDPTELKELDLDSVRPAEEGGYDVRDPEADSLLEDDEED